MQKGRQRFARPMKRAGTRRKSVSDDRSVIDITTLANKIQQASEALQAESTDALRVVREHEEPALAFCHRLLATMRVILDERKSSLPDSGWRVIVVSLITKSMSTVRAAHALAAGGYAREVEILVRSALEALITAMYIAKSDSHRRARRWAQYGVVLRADFLKKHGNISEGSEDKATRQKILAQARRLRKHFPNPRFWAAGLGRGSLRHLAEDVGMLWYYEMVYWLGSQGTHGSAVAIENYVGVSTDGTPQYKMGLSADGLHGDLAVCCDVLLRDLALLSDVCELGLNKISTELIAEYKTAFDGAAVADLVEQRPSGN